MGHREYKIRLRHWLLAVICSVAAVFTVFAQAPGRAAAEPANERLKYQDSPCDVLLKDYSESTKLTLLVDPKVPKGGTVTLRSSTGLTMTEKLQAIETVLGMNGIGLIRTGDKFLKVVPIADARKESLKIRISQELPEDTDKLVSQLIQLKYIDITEAEKAIKSFIHAYGQIQMFERTNSILLTDTAANVNRVIEVLGIVDQPVVKLEEPHIIPIRFSKASAIRAKLEQIVAETQGSEKKSTVPRQKNTGSPGVVRAPSVQGVIRAPRPSVRKTENESVTELIEQAEKGLIRGDVKIIDDDRTNILIIITRPENMVFFNKIIEVLDVETQPDVLVKVVRLEYAKAEDLEGTLNSLIGKGKGKDDANVPASMKGADDAKGAALREYVDRLNAERAAAEKSKSKVGELSSDNIKILSDKRTNALILMGSRGDIAALEEIIKEIDTMLQQVMIEVVIVQVDLDDKVESGIHWVQRGLLIQQRESNGSLTPKGAIAGSAGAGTGDFISSVEDAANLTSIGTWADSVGLSAYFTFFDLDLDAVIRMLQSDTRSKIMSSPRIVATDNTKATIDSSDQVYFLKGNTVDQFGNVTPQVEVKDIGLVLEVTPHINESRNVMMEIVQTVSDVAGSQRIEGQDWPVTKKRSFTANIAVRTGETIVLGGLVRRAQDNRREGVPILSSIPLLGRLFSYKSNGERRSEVVVFITPTVLDTPDAIASNAEKHRKAMDMKGMWQTDWSNSQLAEKTKADLAAEKRAEKEAARRRMSQANLLDKEMEKLPPPPPMQVVVPSHTVEKSDESRPELPVAQPPADQAEKKIDEESGIENLDPELIDFINRQEQKWGKKLEKIDHDIENQMVK